MRQITLTLSRAPGDYIDQLPMYHLWPVLLICFVLLPLTWNCQNFSFIYDMDCHILEF